MIKSLNSLQLSALAFLINAFHGKKLNNFTFSLDEQVGMRGEFEGKLNVQLKIDFEIADLNYEFYFHYDQLEFYILKFGKLLISVNVEDFGSEAQMIDMFSSAVTEKLSKIQNVQDR